MREWYVDDNRQAIDWDTIRDEDGLLTGNIYRLVEMSPGADALRMRWGTAGGEFSQQRVDTAIAATSSDPIPPAHVPAAQPRAASGATFMDPWESYRDYAWAFVDGFTADGDEQRVDWNVGGLGGENDTWGNPEQEGVTLISVNDDGNLVIERTGLYMIEPTFYAEASADAAQVTLFRVGTTPSRIYGPSGTDVFYDLTLDFSGSEAGTEKNAYNLFMSAWTQEARNAWPIQYRTPFSFPAGQVIQSVYLRDGASAPAPVSVGLTFYPLILA